MSDEQQNISTMEQLAALRNFMDQRRGRVVELPVGAAISMIEQQDAEIMRLRAGAKAKYERNIEVVAMNATKLKELKNVIERPRAELDDGDYTLRMMKRDIRDAAFEEAAKMLHARADMLDKQAEFNHNNTTSYAALQLRSATDAIRAKAEEVRGE